MNEEQLRPILENFITELKTLLSQYISDEEIGSVVEKEGSSPSEFKLDADILAELVSHEGIVLESYKDSRGIWTWGIGVTDASGHTVKRYRDNPQTIHKVLEIFEWLVRTKYLPNVQDAFTRDLTKEQLAAALSFHYNTGGIRKASWVKSFNAGNDELAEKQFMNWSSPKEIIPRREKERDLFFHGDWSNNGTALVYQKVNKPSYKPSSKSATRINILKELKEWVS